MDTSCANPDSEKPLIWDNADGTFKAFDSAIEDAALTGS